GFLGHSFHRISYHRAEQYPQGYAIWLHDNFASDDSCDELPKNDQKTLFRMENLQHAPSNHFRQHPSGRCATLSSYDSLHHPNLLFSVVPDLLRYSPIEKIRFVPIPREQRQNSLIAVGDQRIAIIEKPWQTPLSDNLD